MVQITTLTDRQTGAPLYPMTSTKAVFSDAGEDLDALLAGQKQNFQNLLRDYAQKTDLTDGLAKKQDTLSTSEDLQITDGNLLSLTAMAKKRLFIDLWNSACGAHGKYNEATGYFELNGLTDITYKQALEIYTTYNGESRANYDHLAPQPMHARYHIRTLLPINTWIDAISCERFAVYSPSLEVVRFYTSRTDRVLITAKAGFVEMCPKLKAVLCWPKGVFLTHEYTFRGCPALETAQMNLRDFNISFEDSPRLSLASVAFMVDNAANTKPITITVHPDVYAKLTDETNEEWHKVLTDAADKNINFATI